MAPLARPYKGVAVRRLHRGVSPPTLLRGEPGVEHVPCAELYTLVARSGPSVRLSQMGQGWP